MSIPPIPAAGQIVRRSTCGPSLLLEVEHVAPADGLAAAECHATLDGRAGTLRLVIVQTLESGRATSAAVDLGERAARALHDMLNSTFGAEPPPAAAPLTTIESIAYAKLGISNLNDRDDDDLDFHNVSVWALRAALDAAFAAGRAER